MNTPTSRNPMLFCDYCKQWINVYKEGAIRPVTMSKYNMAHQWLLKLAPDLSISELDRISYQKILNEYAEEHEHQTTMDFHHHAKCAILDAVDEGLIPRDPTRKAIIKGKKPREKKQKFLNQFELHKLIEDLDLGPEVSWDYKGNDGFPPTKNQSPVRKIQIDWLTVMQFAGIPVISIHGLRHTHVSLSQGYFWDSLTDCLR